MSKETRKFSPPVWRQLYRKYCAEKERQGGRQLRRAQYRDTLLHTWMYANDRQYHLLSEEELRQLIEVGFSFSDGNLKRWVERYLELCAFARKHGHCKVMPADGSLNTWVKDQRSRRADMLPRQRQMLESLGFSWDPLFEQWMEYYEQLRSFAQTHGHCKVPTKDPQFASLARWVKKQRTKRARMEERRVLLLDKIGFSWRPYQDEWEENFLKLKAIYERHGPEATATIDPAFREVDVWVSVQRRRYRGSPCSDTPLTDEQLQKLRSIGFIFERYDTLWNLKYEELKAFYDKHGHIDIPELATTNRQLGGWMVYQRHRKAVGEMPRAQVRLLNQIGFSWDVHGERWEAKFQALKAFKKSHGHTRVTEDQDEALNRWCVKQRGRHKRGRLPDELVKRLTRLGFRWNKAGGDA